MWTYHRRRLIISRGNNFEIEQLQVTYKYFAEGSFCWLRHCKKIPSVITCGTCDPKLQTSKMCHCRDLIWQGRWSRSGNKTRRIYGAAQCSPEQCRLCTWERLSPLLLRQMEAVMLCVGVGVGRWELGEVGDGRSVHVCVGTCDKGGRGVFTAGSA